MKALAKEYGEVGAFEVWRSWKDTMLKQGRAVADKFLELPIPKQDMELDRQIAEDVVTDFLVWVEGHYGLCLNKQDK